MSINKSTDLSIDKFHESIDLINNENSFINNKELKKDLNINNTVYRNSVGEF